MDILSDKLSRLHTGKYGHDSKTNISNETKWYMHKRKSV